MTTVTDLLGLRFGFYNLVYVMPTRLCNLRCRHCSAESGPDTTGTADIEDLRRWVGSISTTGRAEWIGIEGGEPFAAMVELRALLAAAEAHGLLTAVVSNGFWATSVGDATKILRSVPPISYLMISADEFHQEQLPMEVVGRALQAGLQHTGGVGLQICIGPSHEAFVEALYDTIGPSILSRVDVMMTPLAYTGRARNPGVAQAPELGCALPSGSCPFLGTPVVRQDGAFVACCGREVVLGDEPALLHLGSMNTGGVAEFMAQVDSDVYLQTLRVYGPKAIARVAMENNWEWEPRDYQRNHICDLCRDLAARPAVIEGFRSHGDNPEYRRELALARLAAYDESWPLEAINSEHGE